MCPGNYNKCQFTSAVHQSSPLVQSSDCRLPCSGLVWNEQIWTRISCSHWLNSLTESTELRITCGMMTLFHMQLQSSWTWLRALKSIFTACRLTCNASCVSLSLVCQIQHKPSWALLVHSVPPLQHGQTKWTRFKNSNKLNRRESWTLSSVFWPNCANCADYWRSATVTTVTTS